MSATFMKDCVNLYSIFDVDMDVFAPPFMARSDDEAKVMVRDAICEGSVLHRFPSHYHLYYVGTFDSRVAFVKDLGIRCICSVSDLTYRLSPADNHVDYSPDLSEIPDIEEVCDECSPI